MMICRERDEDPGERLVITVLRVVDEQWLSSLKSPNGEQGASWGLVSDRHANT